MTGMAVLGAILAGGASTRFGSPKALARISGERIVDRVVSAVRAVARDVVVIANDPVIADAIALPWREDAIPGAGALGGIYTSLLWASDRGCDGALVVACDMPFLDAGLLGALVERAGAGTDVVAPESGGPRGIEPLCAFYSVTCLEPVHSAIQRGERRLIGFHSDVRLERLALPETRAFGDPAVLFMNVNTESDLALAERRAAEARA